MNIDYEALAEELAAAAAKSGSQTVGDRLRAQRTDELLTKVLEQLARPQQQVAPVINVPESPAPIVEVKPVVQAQVVSWRFEFERNSDGTIKAIVAKPI